MNRFILLALPLLLAGWSQAAQAQVVSPAWDAYRQGQQPADAPPQAPSQAPLLAPPLGEGEYYRPAARAIERDRGGFFGRQQRRTRHVQQGGGGSQHIGPAGTIGELHAGLVQRPAPVPITQCVVTASVRKDRPEVAPGDLGAHVGEQDARPVAVREQPFDLSRIRHPLQLPKVTGRAEASGFLQVDQAVGKAGILEPHRGALHLR